MSANELNLSIEGVLKGCCCGGGVVLISLLIFSSNQRALPVYFPAGENDQAVVVGLRSNLRLLSALILSVTALGWIRSSGRRFVLRALKWF